MAGVAGDYYGRAGEAAPPKQPVFRTDEDRRSEEGVAKTLSAAWDCIVHPFANLCPVDWWIERGSHLAAVAELKTRTHESTRYPTVFLNLRKWNALMLMATGTGRPAFFVVKFTDGVYWINVAEVDASKISIGGCKRIVKARSDIEPVIEVPVVKLRRLRYRQGGGW